MTIQFKSDFFFGGGSKTGDPREKPPDHLQAELGLSHM